MTTADRLSFSRGDGCRDSVRRARTAEGRGRSLIQIAGPWRVLTGWPYVLPMR